MSERGEKPQTPRVGRPPLSDETVESRVAAYCERYGVAPTAGGVPPFPSGQRETDQHREWLVVYRAVKRLAARTCPVNPRASPRAIQGALACAVCSEPVPPGDDHARDVRLGRARVRLHADCADLVEHARRAGPEALARLTPLLWPAFAKRR